MGGNGIPGIPEVLRFYIKVSIPVLTDFLRSVAGKKQVIDTSRFWQGINIIKANKCVSI